MDCGKSWELMMKRTDGRIGESDSERLDKHIASCGECRIQLGLLKSVTSELESLTFEAPRYIEKSVMSRICSIRQKEKPGLLPYVVSPAALICAFLAIFAFNVYKAGPIPMVDETAHALAFIMKVLQAVAAVAEYVFSILHLHDAIIALPAIVILWFLSILYRSAKKMSGDRIYWRVSK